MEGTASTAGETTSGATTSGETAAGATTSGETRVDRRVLLTSKPLHRFVQTEPKILGIVIVIFGCAEFLMGSQLLNDGMSPFSSYLPFWQGLLFLASGSLSIYAEVHPSKKLVTMCLAMYILSVLGIIVSFIYRTFHLIFFNFGMLVRGISTPAKHQVVGVECVLTISSLCVLGMLIFLCVVARLALRSTRNQVVVHHVQPGHTTITSY